MIISGKVGLRSDGDYDYEQYAIVCDLCHKNDNPYNLITFLEAVEYRKKSPCWRTRKIGGKFIDICSECAKEIPFTVEYNGVEYEIKY